MPCDWVAGSAESQTRLDFGEGVSVLKDEGVLEDESVLGAVLADVRPTSATMVLRPEKEPELAITKSTNCIEASLPELSWLRKMEKIIENSVVFGPETEIDGEKSLFQILFFAQREASVLFVWFFCFGILLERA